jgi:hypothetical protein
MFWWLQFLTQNSFDFKMFDLSLVSKAVIIFTRLVEFLIKPVEKALTKTPCQRVLASKGAACGLVQNYMDNSWLGNCVIYSNIFWNRNSSIVGCILELDSVPSSKCVTCPYLHLTVRSLGRYAVHIFIRCLCYLFNTY